MRKKHKKSQVDVALTVGAVIIPVAALFGALVFAFVMITPFADAARLAAVISFDTVTIADVAYSVPDSIKVFYQPPSSCEFTNSTPGGTKDSLTCLNGFMNFSSRFQFRTVAHSSKISSEKPYCADVPFSIESYFPATIDANVRDSSGNIVQQPFFIAYPGFANIKDYSIASQGDKGLIELEVNNAIIVEKIRQSTFDTLDSKVYTGANDALFEVANNMVSACLTGTNGTTSNALLPHNYQINKSSSNMLLTKITQSPLNLVSPSLRNWSVVYSIDNADFPSECSYFLSLPSEFDPSLPAGNSIEIVTQVTCLSSCDNDTAAGLPSTPHICDGCSDGSTGLACGKQLCPTGQVQTTSTGIEVVE